MSASIYEQLAGVPAVGADVSTRTQDFANRKLYHQLVETLAVEVLPKLVGVGGEGRTELALELFAKEIRPIAANLNPVKYMEIVAFLLKLVAFEDVEAAKEVIADELKAELFGKRVAVAIKPPTFASFYKAQMALWDLAQDASKYYEAAVNYLRYTPVSEVRDVTVESLATNLGVASLVAEGEYNFGQLLGMELFQQPAVKSLWIYDLLYAFQEGKFELYDAAVSKHKAQIAASALLKKNEKLVYEKFCSTVLMEYAFRQPKGKRSIPLAELRKLIRVDDVETLLINAMCADLIKGTIDQVAQIFTYHYVKPRVLDHGRIKDLETRVTQWVDAQTAVLRQFDELTPELLVTV